MKGVDQQPVAAQARAKTNAVDARPADPYSSDCPSRQLLNRIGDRWTVLVVGALGSERLRFSELQRRIEGISQKMLTQTLRSLEQDGLVTRTVYPEVPPRVEYELTEVGSTLQQPLDAIEQWARTHMQHVLDSREKHATAA